MDHEDEVLYFKMQMLRAEIEMNAMKAENQQRKAVGDAPAYGEEQFMALIEKYGIHDNNFPVRRG